MTGTDASNLTTIMFLSGLAVAFLPILLLNNTGVSLLGVLTVLANVVSLPSLFIGGLGIIIWLVAFVLALVARSSAVKKRQHKELLAVLQKSGSTALVKVES